MGDLTLKGATSGQITLTPTAIAGTNTLTVPAKTGNLITSADTGTVTNGMLASNAITSSLLPAGSIVQVVSSQSATYSSSTAVIPPDNTIPQNTEGTEYINATITPKSATNKLLIQFNGFVGTSPAAWITAGLFQDSTANAICATVTYIDSNTATTTIPLTYFMTAGTTSATTFKIRMGIGSGTLYVNGSNTGLMGGVAVINLTIMEIAA